jgi:hypothetical protein
MRQIGLGHYVACHFPLDTPSDPASNQRLAGQL